MRRRFVSGVLASAAAIGLLASASVASAQEIELTGPLKGAPAVRDLRLYREGRLEISPTVSFTLLDEYRRTILAGGQVNYAIKDWLAIGAWGGVGVVSSPTNLTSEINTAAPRNPLTATQVIHNNNPVGDGPGAPPNFADQTAKLNYIIAPQVTFIPFRGKLAIFNKIFVDTDLYVAGGVAIVGISERKPCGASNQLACNVPDSFLTGPETKVAPTFGVGLKFYPASFWSLGVEYRAVPFSWNRGGFDTRGAGPNGDFPDGQINSKDDTFKFNQLINVSVGFYFPTAPKLSE